MDDKQVIWWVIVREDNGYPLIVYADEGRAKQVARVNSEEVVAVTPIEKGVPCNDGNVDLSTVQAKK